MNKNFHFDQFAGRTADPFFADSGADAGNLFQSQFARQHHDIGELRVKTHGFQVGNVRLHGQMNRQPGFPCDPHDSRIGSNHRINSRLFRGTAKTPDLIQFGIVNDRIDREPCFRLPGMTARGNLRQIRRRKIDRGIGAHIQFADAEINGVRSILQCGFQRFETPGGSK